MWRVLFAHTLNQSCTWRLIVYLNVYLIVYIFCIWQVFHLATASHHLIYSGELQFIDYSARAALYVVLMSDLLLLTRPDPDTGNLEVFEQPIGLQDIVGSNFMCSHRKFCRFVLSLDSGWMAFRTFQWYLSVMTLSWSGGCIGFDSWLVGLIDL